MIKTEIDERIDVTVVLPCGLHFNLHTRISDVPVDAREEVREVLAVMERAADEWAATKAARKHPKPVPQWRWWG